MDNENIFAVAITAINIRASLVGEAYLQQQLCNAMVTAFGGGVNSLTLYQQFNLTPNLNSTQGIGQGTLYDTYENNIYLFLAGLYPTTPANQLRTLAMAVNATMLGYSLYQTIDVYDASVLMGNVVWNIAQTVNNNQIFQMFSEDGMGYIIQPFTADVISSLLTNDYMAVLVSIGASPKNTEVQLVNYNWYDTASLFPNPNLQIMMDVENQYYYISGVMNYESDLESLADCVTQIIEVSTPTGIIQTPYIINLPCQQPNNLIAPVNGQLFNRIFNDGPYSSGTFLPTTVEAYMNFDYAELRTADYSSNYETLYSFATGNTGQYIPLYQGSVYVDGQGQYSIPDEYSNVPAPAACVGSYSLMHIGNNRPRPIAEYDTSGNCTGFYYLNRTGFKFAAIQLDSGQWLDNFTYMQTNPLTSRDRFLTRALNTQPLTYVSYLSGDGLVTNPYFGPPQFTGINSLPTLAFFQDFQNVTFRQKGQLVIFPAIGVGGGGGGSDSNRSYTISPTPIFSGNQTGDFSLWDDTPFSLPILTTINSNYGNASDSVIRDFFGMGDGLTTYDNIYTYVEQNAGYFYTGYVVELDGQLYDLLSLTGDAGYSILGSQVSGITYINGYTNGNTNYVQSRFFAQDPTGGLINYYYLDNSVIPAVYGVQENNWTSGQFAPLPTGLEADPTFSHLTTTQQVENYLPRYSRGPYATNLKTILYPNAASAVNQYNAQVNGFPTITFTLNIREEAIKEMYGNFIISRDGFMNTLPVYTNVIRTQADGIDLTVPSPVMHTIFVSDSPAFDYQYDFNNWAIGSDFNYNNSGQLYNMVDNNWSPLVPNRVGVIGDFVMLPSGKNNLNYSDQAQFNQGILLTGNNTMTYTVITGTGAGNFYHYYRERPFANGLYHMFATDTRTGQLTYVLPIFDISNGQLNVNATIQAAFAAMFGVNRSPCGDDDAYGCVALNGANAYFLNGSGTIMTTGQEPLFLQYVGGRSGSPLAVDEGGYHTSGIIGDLWNSFSYDAYGMTRTTCYNTFEGPIVCSYPCNIQERYPSQDNKVILLNGNSSQTQIFTRGLAFSPFVFPFQFNPFEPEMSLAYQVGSGTQESWDLITSGDFISFDLGSLFPYLSMSGSGWYSPTGVTIGPFDRDVELGVTVNNSITSISGDLWWNNNIISLAQVNPTQTFCNQFFLQMRTMVSTGITPGNGDGGTQARDPYFTIFGLVPSGQTANFNLSGWGSGLLGLEPGAIVAVRPRKTYGASLYNNSIQSGEQHWINPFDYLGNGLEQCYTVDNAGGFENLAQTFTFTNYVQTGILYPQPGNDFTGMATIDSLGNYIYPPSATVQKYWENYAVANDTTVIASGIREGSRISFQFTNIQLSWGGIPYQNQRITIPTGKCVISGAFGHVAQADASIVTMGVVLQNNTAYPNSGYQFTPYYVSDVLNRIPGLGLPSGTPYSPVFSAPSVMEQRVVVPVIQDGQQYNQLDTAAPQNYNKFLWPALSDLETLNPGETIEAVPPDDGYTYLNSTAMFSASQGQLLPNGQKNPNINTTYDVVQAYQLYDSIATDSILNSGECITTNRGTTVRMTQSMMSGAVVPEQSTLALVQANLV